MNLPHHINLTFRPVFLFLPTIGGGLLLTGTSPYDFAGRGDAALARAAQNLGSGRGGAEEEGEGSETT